MGKATGFLEYQRLEEGYTPAGERVKHYKEFVIGLSEDDAKKQRSEERRVGKEC